MAKKMTTGEEDGASNSSDNTTPSLNIIGEDVHFME